MVPSSCSVSSACPIICTCIPNTMVHQAETRFRILSEVICGGFSAREPQPRYRGVVYACGNESFAAMQAWSAVSNGMKGPTVSIELHELFQFSKMQIKVFGSILSQIMYKMLHRWYSAISIKHVVSVAEPPLASIDSRVEMTGLPDSKPENSWVEPEGRLVPRFGDGTSMLAR
jgi:hypothetical protein